MARVSLRNIAAHKLRLALTVLAVVLGTAFITGSLLFTNMLERSFDDAIATEFAGVDAVVESGSDGTAVTPAVVAELQNNPDVSRVNESGSTTVIAAQEDETAIQTGQGTSTSGLFYAPEDAVGAGTTVTEGRAPSAAGEAVVNRNGAEKYGIGLDDQLIVVDPSARQTYTIVGFYEEESAHSSSLAFKLTPETYNQYYTDGTTLPGLTVSAKDGVSSEHLVDGLRATYPQYSVETGASMAEEITKTVREGLSFVSYFLVAFGLVGLLVGTFLIANTFSMIVAQRTKEFALLRALGASRRHITRSVTIEAFVVGLLGSVAGVVGGMGLVALIRVVMSRYGMELPGGGLGLSPQAVVIPIVVGVIVTMLSAWAPARRAGQVRPVEAMRASESASPQPLRGRSIVGFILLAAGVAAAVAAVAWKDGGTGDRASLVGGAAVAIIVGFFLAGPALTLPIVPPLGRLIGAPFGMVGILASTNSRRNPRRTSSTAFALVLGIALMTAIGMLGATMKQSISDVAQSEIKADYVLSGPDTGSFPVQNDLPSRVENVDGVGSVVAYGQAPVAVNGEYGRQFGAAGGITPVISGDPSQLVSLTVTQGSSSLEGDTVIASADYAQARGWNVGDPVTISAPAATASTAQATLGGIYDSSTVLGGLVVSSSAAGKVLPHSAVSIIMVGVDGDGSVSAGQLRTNLEEAVRQDIVIQVRSTEDMSGELSGTIDQMLFILYALLSLAVIIAVLGIVNTLTLSIIERRQEIGMLRAVGTQRGQVRTMIVLESVQMAVFGAVSGIALGLGLGWAFLTVLSSQGLDTLVVPWTLVGITLAGSVAAGILAALWPAQRAAVTPPLAAIAE
ncbi:FtsX-like permease family protein [Corynebacterium capitovis]|uniref:ABC transporter permease n=1 Tax=Corynebacterium capitovis TaxID=131081 RepID=UPI0003619BF5